MSSFFRKQITKSDATFIYLNRQISVSAVFSYLPLLSTQKLFGLMVRVTVFPSCVSVFS